MLVQSFLTRQYKIGVICYTGVKEIFNIDISSLFQYRICATNKNPKKKGWIKIRHYLVDTDRYVVYIPKLDKVYRHIFPYAHKKLIELNPSKSNVEIWLKLEEI